MIGIKSNSDLVNKDFIVLASCTHYNHKLSDLWTLCQETHSSCLRLMMSRNLHLFLITLYLSRWLIAPCIHYNHTILRLHEIVTILSWVYWVYTVQYSRLLTITVLSLLFSVYHWLLTAMQTDHIKCKSVSIIKQIKTR